jgi:Ca2+-binding EF-hand superfamily protein
MEMETCINNTPVENYQKLVSSIRAVVEQRPGMSRRGSAKPRPPAGRSGSSQVSYARKPFDKEPHWGVQTVHKLPKKIPDEAMMAAKAMFFSLDRDNSGSIDAVELGVMLRALGQNPTEEELKALIDSVDGADGDEADGQIQLREFLRLYADAIDATGKKVNKVDKSDVNNVFACFGGDLKVRIPPTAP